MKLFTFLSMSLAIKLGSFFFSLFYVIEADQVEITKNTTAAPPHTPEFVPILLDS